MTKEIDLKGEKKAEGETEMESEKAIIKEAEKPSIAFDFSCAHSRASSACCCLLEFNGFLRDSSPRDVKWKEKNCIMLMHAEYLFGGSTLISVLKLNCLVSSR